MKNWWRPEISATYFAMTIAYQLRDKEPHHFMRWDTSYLIDILGYLYDHNSGGFRPSYSDQPNFQSTYYGVRLLGLLEKTHTNPIDKETSFKKIGLDRDRTSKFMMMSYIDRSDRKQNFAELNFAAFQKAFSALIYVRDGELDDNYKNILNEEVNQHSIYGKDDIIHLFKLHYNSEEGTLPAIKPGVLLYEFYRNYREVDFSSLIDFIQEHVISYNLDTFYSPVINFHDSVFALDRIRVECRGNQETLDRIEGIYSTIDEGILNLMDWLTYRGGIMFNGENYSAPNLFATRLLVDVLRRRDKLDLMRTDRAFYFLEDTYDFASGLFRNYPYRSWYYFRNMR